MVQGVILSLFLCISLYALPLSALGGFATSCREISSQRIGSHGDLKLFASCLDARGAWFVASHVRLSNCLGNHDGQLTCRRDMPDHSGNFMNSCANCAIGLDGRSMSCDCRTMNNTIAIAASIDLDSCITNFRGHLVC